MKSRRIIFALFTCVFALYGCVGAVQENATTKPLAVNIKHNASYNYVDASYTMSALSWTDDSSNVARISSLIENPSGQMFGKLRDGDGMLLTKISIEDYAISLRSNTVKKQKQQEAQKRKKAQEAKDAKNTFVGKITTYGLDCYGCNGEDGTGGTAMGVKFDVNQGVQQANGTFQQGIKYGNYYIVAADRNIPMCSILKVSNHGMSGSGISPSTPFYAIVLDRGGAIYGGHLDLYIGTESSKLITPVMAATPTIQILRLGGQTGNSCAL